MECEGEAGLSGVLDSAHPFLIKLTNISSLQFHLQLLLQRRPLRMSPIILSFVIMCRKFQHTETHNVIQTENSSLLSLLGIQNYLVRRICIHITNGIQIISIVSFCRVQNVIYIEEKPYGYNYALILSGWVQCDPLQDYDAVTKQ